MSSDGDLASRLHSWAIKEMHFYSQGTSTQVKLPSVEDFKVLCKGSNAAVWKWVIGHVHATETVKTVKGNLALKRKTTHKQHKVKYGDTEKFEETKSDLQDRRAALSGEITATLRDIGHLDHEVERLTAEISETDSTYEKEKESISNMRRKTALLQAYCEKCSSTVAQYGEYCKCIDTRVTDVKQRAQKAVEREEYYSREVTDQGEEDQELSALETSSAKHVRECCQEIGGFLHDTLKGAFSGDKTEFTKRKEPLWNKVEEVSSTFSADQILTGLLTLTRDTTATVRTMTSRVDIRRDAQNLRFKYESSGEIQDLAKPPSLLSVHQLLQERGSEHLQKFIQTQKYRNEARNLEESIAALKAQIEKRLQRLFTQKPTDFTIARKLIDAELELDGCRASLHCLSQQVESLKEVVESSYRERQELFAKYHQIQEFQQLTDKKQNVIQVLVKQNINSQSRLDAQIEEIKQYIERSLMSYQSQVGSVCSKLDNCVTSEVNDFANLALPYLMFSEIDNALKTAVLDLSIHQTSPSNLRPAMMTVLECLQFPSFQAPEMVLQRCVHIKEEIETIKHKLDRDAWQQQWKRGKEGNKDIVSVIADLCEAVKEEDERQMKKTQPLLQEKINKTASALSSCLQTKDSATAWWEQPGQSCVPWITVDGHNLQYYLDRWTVLSTNLRQILVK